MAACMSDAGKTDYEKITGNPIPRLHKETVLWKAEGSPAKGVLIGVAQPPEAVVKELEAVIETRWGVAERDLSFTDALASFRSKPYNVAPEALSSVIVKIHRFPQRDDLSMIELRRLDKWRDWGRDFHTGLPVPWKVWTSADIVTKGELDTVLDHFAKARVRTASAFPVWPRGVDDAAAAAAILEKLAPTTDP